MVMGVDGAVTDMGTDSRLTIHPRPTFRPMLTPHGPAHRSSCRSSSRAPCGPARAQDALPAPVCFARSFPS